MIYSVKFHQMFHIIPTVMKLRSQKIFFVYKFSLPSNTTSPNGNALEWILWKKWDNWSLTSISIKVAKRFFNQNYTSYSFPLPPFYYHLPNGPLEFVSLKSNFPFIIIWEGQFLINRKQKKNWSSKNVWKK